MLTTLGLVLFILLARYINWTNYGLRIKNSVQWHQKLPCLKTTIFQVEWLRANLIMIEKAYLQYLEPPRLGKKQWLLVNNHSPSQQVSFTAPTMRPHSAKPARCKQLLSRELFSSWKPPVIMIYMNSMLGAMISKAPILHKSQNLQFAEKFA